MKSRSLINMLAFLLGFFLVFGLVARSTAAVSDYEMPTGVYLSNGPTAGRIYINFGGTPSYDSTQDKYDLPALTGAPQTLPKINTNGTLGTQERLVGQTVTAKLPGTDLVKLANGTWTNTAPSTTLTDAYAAAQNAANNPTYDGNAATNCTYFTPDKNTVVGLIRNTCTTFAANTAVIYFQPGGTTKTVAYSGSNLTTVDTVTGHGCQQFYNMAPGQAYANLNGRLAQCTESGGNATVKWYDQQSGKTGLTYDEAKYVPGSGTVTSPGLAAQLASAQAAHATNGLDQDYKQAIEQGGNVTYSSNLTTDEEITTYVNNYYNTTRDTINNTVAGGLTNGTAGDAGNIAQNQATDLALGELGRKIDSTNTKIDTANGKLSDINTKLGDLKTSTDTTNDKLVDIADKLDDQNNTDGMPNPDGQFDGSFSDPGPADSLSYKLGQFHDTLSGSMPDFGANTITASGATSSASTNITVMGATFPVTIDLAPYQWVFNALGAILVFFSGVFSLFIVIGRA